MGNTLSSRRARAREQAAVRGLDNSICLEVEERQCEDGDSYVIVTKTEASATPSGNNSSRAEAVETIPADSELPLSDGESAVTSKQQDEGGETGPGVSDLEAAIKRDSLSTIAESPSSRELTSSGSSQVVDRPKNKEPAETPSLGGLKSSEVPSQVLDGPKGKEPGAYPHNGSAASDTLLSHYQDLIKLVEAEPVAGHLLTKKIIHPNLVEEIGLMSIPIKKSEKLLLELIRKVQPRPEWFEDICQAFEAESVPGVNALRAEYRRNCREKMKSIQDFKMPEPTDEPSMTTETIDKTSEECVPASQPLVQPLNTSTCTTPSNQSNDSPRLLVQPLNISTCTVPSNQGNDFPHSPIQPLDTSIYTTPSSQGNDPPHPPIQPLDISTCTIPTSQGTGSPHPPAQPLNTSTCATPSEQGTNSPQSLTHTTPEPEAKPFAIQHPDPMQIESIMSRLETAFNEGNMEEVESILGDYSPQSEVSRALLEALVRKPKELPDVVKKLLARGVPTKFLLDDGRCLLHLASENRHREIVNLLLPGGRTPSDSGVNAADKQGNTPLHLACNPVQPQNGRCGYESPLQMECQDNALGVVETLLVKGADPLCVNKEGSTPLHLACIAGDVRIVEKLVRHDPATLDGLDKNHNTALHLACIYNSPDVVGKIVHLTPPGRLYALMRRPNIHGDTPIHLATQKNNVTIVKTLLSCKHSTPYLKNPHHGETPLHTACSQDNYEMMKELVERCAREERKAFLNAVNEEQETAMHIACRNGLMRTVKYLKKKGATKRIKNKANMTPADVASQKGHIEIYEYLVLRRRFGKFSRQRHRMSRTGSFDSVFTSSHRSLRSDTASLDTFCSDT